MGSPEKLPYLICKGDKVTDAWDAISQERVVPKPDFVVTDENGEFSIALWPNDRGDVQTFYRCEVKQAGRASIFGVSP